MNLLTSIPLPTRALALLLALVAVGPLARGQEVAGGSIKEVAFDQKLDAQIPPDLEFRDEAGKAVRLGDYFGKKPVILTLVYYKCPLLCGLELKGLETCLKPLKFDVGKEFDIVTVSFSPTETPELASEKKAAYIEDYGRPGAAQGWHFLTGKADAIASLARTAGFRYLYDPKSQNYTHASGLLVLTPGGKISRYFYGVEYPPRDMQFALMESSAYRIGSPIARVLLFCYHYDAATGKYTANIVMLTRVLGVATVLVLATSMVVMVRRDRARIRAAMAPEVSGVRG